MHIVSEFRYAAVTIVLFSSDCLVMFARTAPCDSLSRVLAGITVRSGGDLRLCSASNPSSTSRKLHLQKEN